MRPARYPEIELDTEREMSYIPGMQQEGGMSKRDEPKPEVVLVTLGNLIGGASHFGHCADCGAQHVSTHDRVQRRGHEVVCARCAK